MTQNNPYRYEQDLDDDIFQTDSETKSGEKRVNSRRHTLDGSVCPNCQVVHAIEGLPDNLPPAVRDKILDFIDNIPDEILKRADGLLAAAVPSQPKFAMDFMNFVVDVDSHNHEGPLMRAMAEYLDKQSDGAVSRMWEVYELERRLISSHLILKSVNTHLDDSKNEGAPEDALTILDFFVNFMVDRIAAITIEYREKASAAGIEVNETLISSGTYGDDPSKMVQHTMLEAMALNL